MYELMVKADIASAHFLRGYEGPCKNLHGHTWKIEIKAVSDQLNDIGMVVDFRELKMKLKKFLEHLDHVCLNDIGYFKEVNPTAENIAKYIYQNFQNEISPVKLSSVKVFESDSSSVTYYEK